MRFKHSAKLAAPLVLIAHRPRLLAQMDKILVLRDGAIEIFGDREEVLAKLNPLTAVDSPPQQQRKAAACA